MDYPEKAWWNNLRTPRTLEGEVHKQFDVYWGDIIIGVVSIVAFVGLLVYLLLKTWPLWR